MAFLDNNIITLDAVLTDVGRKRLAQGNGSFVISQFGLGDDEINYGLYDTSNSNGSAYYDLNILQTPVFEAITNSTTALKHSLISLTDNPKTLFLPILKLNTLKSGKGQYNGSYVVVSNDTAYTTLVGSANTSALTRYTGFTDGRGSTTTNASGAPTFLIEVDQGIDNSGAGGNTSTLSADLTETQFAVYMNNLFLEPIDSNGTSATSIVTNTQGTLTVTQTGIYNTVDNTAAYMLTNTTTPNYFGDAPVSNLSPFTGPQGPSLQFGLKASTTLLNNLSYYFTKYGSSQTNFSGVSGLNVKVISTSVKVKGMSLGYELSIPIQLIAQF
jgi:hypothetical protein